MIGWDFQIARVTTWSTLPADDVIPDITPEALPTIVDDDTEPGPWLDIGLTIESTDRQLFSLQVETLHSFLWRRSAALPPSMGTTNHSSAYPPITSCTWPHGMNRPCW